MNDKKVKPIRFAALIRVSTEQQEDQNESLLCQTDHINDAVKRIGKIVEWYGGAEHATAGHEKKEIERLLKDAAKNKFDAVIIDRADRWSRDNQVSARGLEVFKANDIRFFIQSSEKDLFDPADEFFVNFSVQIAAYNAQMLKKIVRSSKKRRMEFNKPVGNRPYGRTYDKNTEKWDIDIEKQNLIIDAAHRYIAGESLSKIAEEIGMDHSGLHRILMKRCGTDWEQKQKSVNGKETKTYKMVIPRLLDDDVIEAVRQRAKANSTLKHGHIKNKYLLSRMIFCEHCGFALFGQTTSYGTKSYRHTSKNHPNKAAKKCKRHDGCNTVPADEIEKAVLTKLFNIFGDVKTVQQAIEKATPNQDKVNQKRKRIAVIEKELEKTSSAIDRVMKLVVADKISEELSKKTLDGLNSKTARLTEDRELLKSAIQHLPTPDMIRKAAKSVRVSTAKRRAKSEAWLNGKMPYKNKRELLELVFAGTTADGKRNGVYVTWNAPKEYTIEIKGCFDSLLKDLTTSTTF